MVYSVAKYSETLFFFLQILGMKLIYMRSGKIQTKKVLLASVLWSFGTMIRFNGCYTVVIPLFFALHKLIRNFFDLEVAKVPLTGCRGCLSSFLKGAKYLFYMQVTLFAMVIFPLFIVSIWKPYEIYCLSRLDTDWPVPDWCWDEFLPNVYSYVQAKYWHVGFGKFMERPWYLLATSLFTNQLFLYVIYRQASTQGLKRLLTLNLYESGKFFQPERTRQDAFYSKAMVPHFWVLVLNLLTVLLFANTEINARVGSTCVFYFIALSQLVVETVDELKQSKGKVTYKHVLVFMTMLYNGIVMILNFLLFSVGIGFI